MLYLESSSPTPYIESSSPTPWEATDIDYNTQILGKPNHIINWAEHNGKTIDNYTLKLYNNGKLYIEYIQNKERIQKLVSYSLKNRIIYIFKYNDKLYGHEQASPDKKSRVLTMDISKFIREVITGEPGACSLEIDISNNNNIDKFKSAINSCLNDASSSKYIPIICNGNKYKVYTQHYSTTALKGTSVSKDLSKSGTNLKTLSYPSMMQYNYNNTSCSNLTNATPAWIGFNLVSSVTISNHNCSASNNVRYLVFIKDSVTATVN